ncbi:ECF RNA polymerase sigma-E factor [Enhygromyxa salina]|uniref:ECF RNA polymerase sigma-E factor n=1 Tax=Enhygromyxa salina TaxID=215803 RepID=A0A2S9XHL1_9BACT|nr:sigma-70 family RNA polymerase sigma factor [Enhygromyxa salina]PRP92352.1 ECF RNA polymerase sigma-E factor [Enhygromyxa salina]
MSSTAQHRAAPALTLADVYRDEFDFVWRSLRRLGVPAHALEDATQDVFVVVARRLDEFEARSSLRTWLFGIAMRVVQTRRRTVWRHQRKLDVLAREPQAAHDPLARSDARRLLLRLLDELGEDKRAVYVLVELEGMTAVEVAAGLEVNVNTIYTRLRAARRELLAAAAKCADLRDEGGAPP